LATCTKLKWLASCQISYLADVNAFVVSYTVSFF